MDIPFLAEPRMAKFYNMLNYTFDLFVNLVPNNA